MKRVLVTGGAGFIGAHLVRALRERGESVRILDDFSSGRAEILAGAAGLPAAEVQQALEAADSNQPRPITFSDTLELLIGDIRDPAVCAVGVKGVHVVFHQAAVRSVPRSIEDPVTVNAVNVTGTQNLLFAALEAGVQRFVYASSSSVYGETVRLPKRETDLPLPISPYAASKLAGEYYCRAFARTYGLHTVSLRYFNVFGPWQDPANPYAAVIPKFIHAALTGRELEIHGDGRQTRDFTFVSNVIRANLLAAEHDVPSGGVYNIGTGQRYSIVDLVEALSTVLTRRLAVRHTPPRKGDVRDSLADISRAEQDLGYQVEVSFQDGLSRTILAIQAAYSHA